MEQRNSIQFLTLTFIISFSLIVLTFGISTGVKAMRGQSDNAYFGTDTFIGPVKVDGLNKEQATLVLTQNIDNWTKQKSAIRLLFNEAKLEHTLLDFNIEASVSEARTGKRNPLSVSIDEEELSRTFESMALSSTEEIDRQKFKSFLLEHAVHLTPLPATIHLSHYFMNQSEENHLFASVTLNTVDHDESFKNWARKHNEITVKEDTVFSLNEIIKNEANGLYTEAFTNALSSAIYKAALNSPFSIVERFTSTDNRFNQEVGYEAFVDLQHDLKMMNDYGRPLKIVSTMKEGTLIVSVEGSESPMTITSSIREQVELKPRIIVYPVENYSDEYEVKGKNGKIVTIVRTVSIGESTWKTFIQSVDSYLPIPEKWYRVFEEDRSGERPKDNQ